MTVSPTSTGFSADYSNNYQGPDPNDVFPFQLDEFQERAIAALNSDKSVVVCAPTGSGKTLVGEYAIYRALSHGKRVFYTTPLKALSNQKLRDFREQFGEDQVGLLTGDMSVNRDAPVLVMDEATSSLDSESEAKVAAAAERLMEGRTTLVIAHRLATVAKLDRLLVFDKGRIVEDGTPEELLAREDGLYRALHQRQAGALAA